jgi:hypothetical protein
MTWDVEYTDEFGDWWAGLTEAEQVSVAASVQLLQARGPSLGHPHTSGINGSKHGHMRELRTQHAGRPYRTLYAFDPRRMAILLIGGEKPGTIVGMKFMSPSPINCMTNTWNNFDVKENTDGQEIF